MNSSCLAVRAQRLPHADNSNIFQATHKAENFLTKYTTISFSLTVLLCGAIYRLMKLCIAVLSVIAFCYQVRIKHAIVISRWFALTVLTDVRAV